MNPDFPPRVFFSDFNDCSLNIMMLYWYHPPDYWTYMEFTEKVNHEILTRFNEEGIEFAFPTQTLYLANDEKRQLAVRLLKEQS
jgi:MscS family membrane protein